MNPQILSERQRLDALFSLTKQLPQNEEMLAHWSRYLCVLVSGFIENSVKILVVSYAEKKCHPYILNYISQNIKGVTNLNDDKIRQLVGSFSEDWRRILDTRIRDDQKAAIDSILANRHNIVHGRPVGISFVPLRDWYRLTVEVVEILENDCLTRGSWVP